MKKLLALLFVALLATGCNSIPQQSFNAEANKTIKTIALIAPPTIKQVEVSIVHHPAASFGLIGAAIMAADTAGKTKAYNNALKQSIDWSAYAQQALKTKLEQSGYTVKMIQARSASDEKRAFMEKYPATEADALLDYYYNVRHLATGATTDYLPTVTIFSRLVKSADQSVIYAQHFTAGNPAIVAKGAVISPSTVGFKDMAVLKENSAKSAQALKDNIEQIADLIGKDLKK